MTRARPCCGIAITSIAAVRDAAADYDTVHLIGLNF
jgi:hypothetical protein